MYMLDCKLTLTRSSHWFAPYQIARLEHIQFDRASEIQIEISQLIAKLEWAKTFLQIYRGYRKAWQVRITEEA